MNKASQGQGLGMLKTIEVRRITQEIISQVRTLIAEGNLKPGDRLPAEREMARKLGVSRPSLREALLVLAHTGFVDIVRGSGTYVREIGQQHLFDPLHALIRDSAERHVDVYEFRTETETWAAGLAAERRTPSELATLTQIVDQMRQRHEAGQDVDKLDTEFHLAIAKASHNRIYLHVADTIVHLFADVAHISHKEIFLSSKDQLMLMNEHQNIHNAIATGDPTLARRLMRQHLNRVITRIKKISNFENK